MFPRLNKNTGAVCGRKLVWSCLVSEQAGAVASSGYFEAKEWMSENVLFRYLVVLISRFLSKVSSKFILLHPYIRRVETRMLKIFCSEAM